MMCVVLFTYVYAVGVCEIQVRTRCLSLPKGANWPNMMFSETPLSQSVSECTAASNRISTVSSNEHLRVGGKGGRLKTHWIFVVFI